MSRRLYGLYTCVSWSLGVWLVFPRTRLYMREASVTHIRCVYTSPNLVDDSLLEECESSLSRISRKLPAKRTTTSGKFLAMREYSRESFLCNLLVYACAVLTKSSRRLLMLLVWTRSSKFSENKIFMLFCLDIFFHSLYSNHIEC